MKINESFTGQKPLMLDSIISPSAVNIEFYNKVIEDQPSNNYAKFNIFTNTILC